MAGESMVAGGGMLNLDASYFVAKRWLLFYWIAREWPDGIAESEVVPLLIRKWLQRGIVPRCPPEPYPVEHLKLFVADKHMTKVEKENPGTAYVATETGRKEMARLMEELRLEEVLGLGPWDQL